MSIKVRKFALLASTWLIAREWENTRRFGDPLPLITVQINIKSSGCTDSGHILSMCRCKQKICAWDYPHLQVVKCLRCWNFRHFLNRFCVLVIVTLAFYCLVGLLADSQRFSTEIATFHLGGKFTIFSNFCFYDCAPACFACVIAQ